MHILIAFEPIHVFLAYSEIREYECGVENVENMNENSNVELQPKTALF